MRFRQATRVLIAAARLCQLLLWAYPKSFRQEYGAKKIQVFLDSCHDGYRQCGLVCLAQL
jgi:hypothetical protein